VIRRRVIDAAGHIGTDLPGSAAVSRLLMLSTKIRNRLSSDSPWLFKTLALAGFDFANLDLNTKPSAALNDGVGLGPHLVECGLGLAQQLIEWQPPKRIGKVGAEPSVVRHHL
jgi:hypothetical protein